MDDPAHGQQETVVPPIAVQLYLVEHAPSHSHDRHTGELRECVSDACPHFGVQVWNAQQRGQSRTQDPVVKHVLSHFLEGTRDPSPAAQRPFSCLAYVHLPSDSPEIFVHFVISAVKPLSGQSKRTLDEHLAQEIENVVQFAYRV